MNSSLPLSIDERLSAKALEGLILPFSMRYIILELSPFLTFYQWMTSFVKEEIVQEAMLLVHIEHSKNTDHQVIGETLYLYWNSRLLDPLLELLFLRSRQFVKLAALQDIHPRQFIK